MHALFLTAALLLGQDDPSQAPLEAPTNSLKVLGFTKDHQSVVYSGWYGSEDFAREVTVVLGLNTGATQLLEGDGAEAWLKKHPLDAAVASRASPDGKATADVVVDANDNDGAWRDGAWSASKTSAWKLSVTRGKATTTAGTCPPADSAEVYWSPDGHFTAWIITVGSRGMRDPGYQSLIIGSDGRPTAAVVMDPAKLKDGAPKVIGLLDGLGFAVLATTPAQKARPATVVFARKGFEDQAKALAAKFPGSAVEPLTWAAGTDVVVYVK